MSFESICRDIKSLKIQGARNVAIAGIKALSFKRDKKSIQKLLNLRSTEPALRNSVKFVLRNFSDDYKKALNHFKDSDKKISKIGSKLIKNNTVVFTHCHSSSVVNVLKEAKKQGKKFRVNVTETRPLFQGRITAKELNRAKIKVTLFVDSALENAIEESDIVLIGADAIISDKKNKEVVGVYNKIGSGVISEIAFNRNVPVYVCSDSWKFNPYTLLGKKEVIEERSPTEVWRTSLVIKIRNPAFEIVKAKFIKGIVCELGNLSVKNFVKRVLKEYTWMLK